MLRKNLKITKELRTILGKPLGLLIEGDFERTVQIAKVNIKQINPPKIICVGDVVSRNLLNAGIKVNIFIIDGKTLRTEKEEVGFSGEQKIVISNPQGFIMSKVWEILEEAMKSDKQVEILVNGEEDLLGLPAVILAPLNSLVFYGQPPIFGSSGLVMIHVTKEKVKEFQNYIDMMKVL
ncbi:MAG: GTP-dependent dephospho-CoA kinase family protein [Candidatus Helarchaeota archaeon]